MEVVSIAAIFWMVLIFIMLAWLVTQTWQLVKMVREILK